MVASAAEGVAPVLSWQPLVVHRFRAINADGSEVCLDPRLAFVELVAELSGAESLVFAESSLPEVAGRPGRPGPKRKNLTFFFFIFSCFSKMYQIWSNKLSKSNLS